MLGETDSQKIVRLESESMKSASKARRALSDKTRCAASPARLHSVILNDPTTAFIFNRTGSPEMLLVGTARTRTWAQSNRRFGTGRA